MIEPHGGTLVDQVFDGDLRDQTENTVEDGPFLQLDHTHYQEVINIATGRFSPLEGFLDQNDFLKVVHDMTLEDGTTWTIPIVLDIDGETAGNLTPGQKAGLLAPEGERLVGAVDISQIYKYNETETARELFGTDDPDHPGVANLYDRDDFLVGGKIFLFDEERYNGHDLLPAESRVLFSQRDWNSVAGFQTRNAPHRAHEYIQKAALEHTDGLLVQPKLGDKKAGDYRDDVIIGAYERFLEEFYRDDRVALSAFPSKMRYAGPREAVFDAIVRKNQGCTHFVVGRDHAGVGDYYGGFESQSIFDEIDDIGIEPLFFSYSFYCERCDGMASEKICPHDEDVQIHPSGSTIRERIKNGRQPPAKMMRPVVAEYIMDAEKPFVTEQDEGGDGK